MSLALRPRITNLHALCVGALALSCGFASSGCSGGKDSGAPGFNTDAGADTGSTQDAAGAGDSTAPPSDASKDSSILGPEDSGADSGPEAAPGDDSGIDSGVTEPGDTGAEQADTGAVDSGVADTGSEEPPETGASDTGAATDTGMVGPADTGTDATLDSGPADTGMTGPMDTGTDATTDAGSPQDAHMETSVDAPAEASSDTGTVAETGTEAGTDAASEAGTEAGTDGGAGGSTSGCGATIAVLGGNATTAFASTWNGTWGATQTLTGSVASVPALVSNGSSYVGVVQASATNDIDFTVSGTTWSALTGVSAGNATATTGGPPALAVVGSAVHLVYWGTDDKFYHGTYSAGAWSPANDPVGGASSQSFGPSAPTAAGLSATSFSIAQAGSNAGLYVQPWATTWGAAAPVATDTYDVTSPRIIELTGGAATQMVVYSRNDNGNDEVLMYSVLTGGTWSAPAVVRDTTVYTPNTVALAPLASGGALLVYQGGNGEGYYTTYEPGGANPWAAPAPLVAGTNPTLASPPQIAPGVCGAEAVAVLAPAGASVEVTTLTGSTWSTPSTIAGTSGATYATVATHPCTSTMAILGGSSTTALASTWSGGAWGAVQTLTGSVASVPALVSNGSSYVGVVQASATNDIDFTVSGTTWSALTGVSAGNATATTGGPPALAVVGSAVHLVYWGTDDKFYHGTYSAGAWSPANDPVGGASSQSFGPSAPTAAGLSATSFSIAQAGSNAGLYVQPWATTWGAAAPVATDTYDVTSPRIIELTGGAATQMVVYSRNDNGNDEVLMYSVLTGGTWSAPAVVRDTTVYTPNTVALAPLASGGALLVYQGGNGEGYYTTYEPGGANPWAAPAPLVAGTNPTLASPPQIAPGVCGAEAVVVFAPVGSSLETSTLTGSTWSTPSALAGTSGATYATIATQP